jgi:hypothetical protein
VALAEVEVEEDVVVEVEVVSVEAEEEIEIGAVWGNEVEALQEAVVEGPGVVQKSWSNLIDTQVLLDLLCFY